MSKQHRQPLNYAEEAAAVLALLNTLHSQYRYVTFSIDRDGDLCANHDVIFHSADDELLYALMNMLRVFMDMADPVTKAVKEVLRENTSEDDIHVIFTNLFGTD